MELRVEKKTEQAFNDEDFSVKAQEKVIHNKKSKRMDVKINQRRPGGKGLVIDAKDYSTPLPKHAVDTTKQYQKDSRATAACIVTAKDTPVPDTTKEYAEQENVKIIVENRNLSSNLKKFAESNSIPVPQHIAPVTLSEVDGRCSSVRTGAVSFTNSGSVDRRCEAVRNRSVLLTNSGSVDKRCSAYRSGTLELKGDR